MAGICCWCIKLITELSQVSNTMSVFSLLDTSNDTFYTYSFSGTNFLQKENCHCLHMIIKINFKLFLGFSEIFKTVLQSFVKQCILSSLGTKFWYTCYLNFLWIPS